MFMCIIICRVFINPHNRAIDTDKNRAIKRLMTNVKFNVVSEQVPTYSRQTSAAIFNLKPIILTCHFKLWWKFKNQCSVYSNR
ncbi:hypothetical protein FGO68_gene2048 [Halteria grandinella]|uniref:Uncharacterized protein n=1 Tax=Halteria grandinella TaxID=5974 RepID=A0A8J8P6I3_HALGN|nr:hypothetical protein FGO68_gene2048 [Halteria grandinella]